MGVRTLVDDVGQLLQSVAAGGQSPPPGNNDILSGHPLKDVYVQLFYFFVICDLTMTNERSGD